MMMVVMMVMTRRLMVQLLVVLRSRVASGHHGTLMKTVARGRSGMVVMMMVVSVRRLLNVVTLVRIYRSMGAVRVLMLLTVR